MSHTPDPRAAGISTISYCRLLSPQRLSHDARGRILLMPGSGLTVVPFEMRKGGGWTVVVVDGYGSYPVGGYHLVIGDAEITTAIELAAGEPVPTRFVGGRAEAERLADGETLLTRNATVFTKKSIDGVVMWTRWLKEPVPTSSLDDTHFPAKVLGAPGEENAAV